MRIALAAALLVAGCVTAVIALSAPAPVQRFTSYSDILDVHFSPDGSHFLAISQLELRFANIATREIVEEKLDGRAGSFRLLRGIEDDRFALVGADGIRLYDMEQGDLVARLGSGFVKAYHYDPRSKRVAALLQRLEYTKNRRSYYYPIRLVVYDIADEVDRGWFDKGWHAVFGRSSPDPVFEVELDVSKKQTEEWRYTLVTLREQGTEVAVLGYPDAIFWSVDEEEEIRRFQTDASKPPYTISPDGTHFISCGGRIFDIELWSLDSGRKVATMEQPGYPRRCRFSRDGSKVVIDSVHYSQQFEAIWSAQTGLEMETSEIEPEFAQDATGWSGDGNTYVAVSRHGALRVFGADDEEPTGTGRLPRGYLDESALRYDRDPNQAVYVNTDGSHAVWVIGRQAVIWSLR
jgi:WD40 repeat protein